MAATSTISISGSSPGGSYAQRLERAINALHQARCILIGGGAGLSDAAGLHYAGRRFTDNFAPFIARYGFDDNMYRAGFYPFPTPEAKWAYWARHVSLNRYEEPPASLYRELLRLIHGKTHFVLTTNVESQFVKAGFAADHVFAVQGDYGLFQCARACHDTLYDNEATIAEMLQQTRDCAIPSHLVPLCPQCGGLMDLNLRKDHSFVEDQHWRKARQCYLDFLRASEGRGLVLLELGVGFNTPGIIRFPFEELVAARPDAVLIRANRDNPYGVFENRNRTISFTEDMGELLQNLLHGLGIGQKEGA